MLMMNEWREWKNIEGQRGRTLVQLHGECKEYDVPSLIRCTTSFRDAFENGEKMPAMTIGIEDKVESLCKRS